jgi:hypothetical protein
MKHYIRIEHEDDDNELLKYFLKSLAHTMESHIHEKYFIFYWRLLD